MPFALHGLIGILPEWRRIFLVAIKPEHFLDTWAEEPLLGRTSLTLLAAQKNLITVSAIARFATRFDQQSRLG